MTTVHSLITQDKQTVQTITATNVKPSSAIRRGNVSRVGNGIVNLIGPYTGHDDATFDIEIVPGGITRITEPTFTGVGIGLIDSLEVLPAAVVDEWVIELVSLGIDTTTAQTDIEGFTVQATVVGALGNQITLDVDQSGLTELATTFSLIEDISEGTSQIAGSQYDWDSVVGINAPTDAKRIRFGDDLSQIYIQWKKYQDGEYQYNFAPPLNKGYRAGTVIKEITGSRTVTVTNGVITDIYANIITLIDLLKAIRDDQSPTKLLSVVGVIPEDRSQNSVILDLRTRTDGRIDGTSGTGSDSATGFTNTAVDVNASTEIIQATCFATLRKDGASLGLERWRLKGSVSGDLGEYVSGINYVHPGNKFSLTIPQKFPEGYVEGEIRGEIGINYEQDTGATGAPPNVSANLLVLGTEAVDKEITFEYELQPVTGNDASKIVASGEIDPNNLATDGVNADLSSVEYTNRTAIEDQFLIDLQSNTNITTLTTYKVRFSVTGTGFGPVLVQTVEEFATLVDANNFIAGLTTTFDVFYNLNQGFRQAIQIGTLITTVDVLGATTANATAFPNTTTTITKTAFYTGGGIQGDTFLTLNPLASAVSVTLSGAVDFQVDTDTINNEFNNANIVFTNNAFRVINFCLANMLNTPAALTDWDILYGEVTTTILANLNASGNTDYDDAQTAYLKQWEADCNAILTANGLPAVATVTSISQADESATHWWKDTDGIYEPFYTNHLSVSAIKDSNGDIKPTKEWGASISVSDPALLTLGDQVTFKIANAGWQPTYQVGDVLTLITISADPIQLVGGLDGTDTKVWSVNGLTKTADYLQTLTPPVYDNGSIKFRILDGGFPYTLGDQYKVCVEDGQFKWRKDTGAYSANLPIVTTALSDGISAEFIEGSCDSFVNGDVISFNALQPYSPSGAASSNENAYQWDVSTVITLVCTADVTKIVLGMHNLTQDITVSDGANNFIMSVSGNVSELTIPLRSSPTLTLTINEPGKIAWLWAGEAHDLIGNSDDLKQIRTWQVLRGNGLNPTGTLRGKGVGYTMGFNLNIVMADIELLTLAINAHKALGDVPAVIIPHSNRAFIDLVILPDQLEISSESQFGGISMESDISDVVSVVLALESWLE